MKKIYKVVVRYGYMTENGIRYNTDWEFFATKKAYQRWINIAEEGGWFSDNEIATAEVYVMTADHKGRFVENYNMIDNFNFSTNKKAMFV